MLYFGTWKLTIAASVVQVSIAVPCSKKNNYMVDLAAYTILITFPWRFTKLFRYQRFFTRTALSQIFRLTPNLRTFSITLKRFKNLYCTCPNGEKTFQTLTTFKTSLLCKLEDGTYNVGIPNIPNYITNTQFMIAKTFS